MRTILIELISSLASYDIAKQIFNVFPKEGQVSCTMDPNEGYLALTIDRLSPKQAQFLDTHDKIYDWSNMPAMTDLVACCNHHIHISHLTARCSLCNWQCAPYGCYECGERVCASCVCFGKNSAKFCKLHGGICDIC